MAEEIPRFEGDREDTYAEVEAVGPLGEKRLRIGLGVPGSRFDVHLSGEKLQNFFSQIVHEVSRAQNEADEDTPCAACGCLKYVSRVYWYTKKTFRDEIWSRDKEEAEIEEFCGSPQDFPVALCVDCTCPK